MRAGEPGFLVTGPGRSGTKHLAAVLRRCGLKVGHEDWWTLEHHGPVPGLDGDVSWLGCFDEGYTGRVLAQTRDPQTCVPSIAANLYVHPWWLVRSQRVALTGDKAVDACRIWATWTERAWDRAESRWHVEDLDAALLARVFSVDPRRAEDSLRLTSKRLNHRAGTRGFVWPDHPATAEVERVSRLVGYGRIDP